MSNQRLRINEEIVKALPPVERGSKIHYFGGARAQGTQAPRGFGVRVMAGGTKSFVIRYSVRGRNQERLYVIGRFPDWTVVDAVKEARRLRQCADRSEDPLAARQRQAKPRDTVQAICEEYFAREGKRLRSRDEQERTLKRLIYPEFGNRDVASIKRIEITRLFDRIEDENGPVMADRTLASIRKIFNWHAVRSEDEFSSPIIRGMARTKGAERARQRILADDELRAVWRVAEVSTGSFGHLVRFILLTAARREEAAGMTWAELPDGVWVLPAARNKTKVDLARPLSREARAVLPARHGLFVFSTNRMRPISGFSKMLKAMHAASGTSGWALHDLRRTARSLMSRAGVPTDHAERCLGHVIGGVRKAYDVWEYKPEKERAYNALAALIERILNPLNNVVPIKTEASP